MHRLGRVGLCDRVADHNLHWFLGRGEGISISHGRNVLLTTHWKITRIFLENVRFGAF